jgi:uncharacterized protein YndB with AHSA1/START domain
MIDVDHQISAVNRTVGSRELPAGEARVVTVAQRYPTTAEDLWEACTQAERIVRWFLPVSGELRLGGRYQLEGNAGGTVERCDPPHGFDATWEFDGNVSWIEVRVRPDGDGARLELTHIAHVDDKWSQFGPGAVGIGWDMSLVGLALHMADPTAERPDGMAWMTSPDGIRFMTLSSDRWGAADAASGTDQADALARAKNTLAAYTGSE